MKPKLLIADDHILFNEGVKQLIAEEFEVVAQVFDGKEVLWAIQRYGPDIILLDINLPSVHGFELAREIKKSFVALKVIFLSMYMEPKFVEQARELNVEGYLLKHSSREELIEGISQVWKGQVYFDPKLGKPTKNLHQDDYFVRQFSLTPREVEIIGMIRQGLSTPEIAEKLHLSTETVKTHRKNIYYKLSITKLSELIRFAMENQIGS